MPFKNVFQLFLTKLFVQVSTCHNHKYADVTLGKPFGENFWCKLLVQASGIRQPGACRQQGAMSSSG
jgi:hypothetical protein